MSTDLQLAGTATAWLPEGIYKVLGGVIVEPPNLEKVEDVSGLYLIVGPTDYSLSESFDVRLLRLPLPNPSEQETVQTWLLCPEAKKSIIVLGEACTLRRGNDNVLGWPLMLTAPPPSAPVREFVL